MADNNTQNIGFQKGNSYNPTGKGGFRDHPEHRNNGTWDVRKSFTYQMNKFKNMTVSEFLKWPDNCPNDIRTVAEDLAYQRVFNARKDLMEFKEVADRTEGKATQPIDHGLDDSVYDTISRLNGMRDDYGEYAKDGVAAVIAEQKVENGTPVQDQGQAGADSNIQAKPDATPVSDGQGRTQV